MTATRRRPYAISTFDSPWLAPGFAFLLATAMPIEPLAAQELEAEKVEVRSGQHDDYGRVVFDWPAPVGYEIVRNVDDLVVTFDRPGVMDLSAVVARTGGRLTEARVEDDDMSIVLGIKGGTEYRIYEFDNDVLAIDLLDGLPADADRSVITETELIDMPDTGKNASLSAQPSMFAPNASNLSVGKDDEIITKELDEIGERLQPEPDAERHDLVNDEDVLQLAAIGDQTTTLTDTENDRQTDRCVLGWVPYWDQKRALQSFMQNIELFGHLSTFWYYLDDEGRIVTYQNVDEDRRIIQFAQENGVKVLGLIANLPDEQPNPWLAFASSLLDQIIERDDSDESWDRARVAKMLETPESRRRHIADIVNLAERMNFDGINIDYEALLREDRERFSLFIEELANALHERGKILAVALHAKTAEFNPLEDNGSHAQDWKRISAAADQLHFITYGQHWAGTPPGPIASPAWVEHVLEYAVEERALPRDKVVFGLPLYAEDWFKNDKDCYLGSCYEGSGDEMTYSDIRQFLREQDIDVQWDAEHQTSYIVFDASDDSQHIIWFEDSRSLEAKLELRDRYDICHVGLWRLGGEDPKVWDVIRRAMQGRSPGKTTAKARQ